MVSTIAQRMASVRHAFNDNTIRTFANDPDFKLFQHSEVGSHLLLRAAGDGVRFFKARDPEFKTRRVGTYYVRDTEISLRDSSNLDSLAHELTHHHHKETNLNDTSKNSGAKNGVLIKLIHEAEAEAAKAIICLQICRKAGLTSIAAIYATSEEEYPLVCIYDRLRTSYDAATIDRFFQNPEADELQLGRFVFDSYLSNPERNEYHSNYYPPRFSASSFNGGLVKVFAPLALASGGILSFISFEQMKETPFLVSAFVTALANTGLGLRNIFNDIKNYNNQTPIEELIPSLDLGSLPGLKGNYLNDTTGMDWSSPEFKALEQKVSMKMDAAQTEFGHERVKELETIKMHIDEIRNRVTEFTNGLNL